MLRGSCRVFDSLIFGAVPGTYLGVVYWSAWWWGACESVCGQVGWYNIIFYWWIDRVARIVAMRKWIFPVFLVKPQFWLGGMGV